LKVKHAQNEKSMEEIERKNAELTLPLKETEAEVHLLQKSLLNYDKDKISLRSHHRHTTVTPLSHHCHTTVTPLQHRCNTAATPL
jgi:hypothetical protein